MVCMWVAFHEKDAITKTAKKTKTTQTATNNRERKISPKFFRPKFFQGRPRRTSVPKCSFFQDLEGLTEVFGRTSAGISGQKLPLWAAFSLLKQGAECWISGNHGKRRKSRKPRESGVQTTGSPNNGFRNTRVCRSFKGQHD